MSGGPDELGHHWGAACDIAADGSMGTATRRDGRGGTPADPLPEGPAMEAAAGGATAADQDRALHALTLAWGDQYDEFWVCDGKWGAHREGDPDLDVISAATPDELNRAIREREVTP